MAVAYTNLPRYNFGQVVKEEEEAEEEEEEEAEEEEEEECKTSLPADIVGWNWMSLKQ